MLFEGAGVSVSSFIALFLEVMSSAPFYVNYLCIIFGCAGSLAAAGGGFSSWQGTGSVHTSSVVVAHRLSAPRHVGSFHTGDRTCVPCMSRQALLFSMYFFLIEG